MNTELKPYSIVRKRKPAYEYKEAHKVFENRLVRDLKADDINKAALAKETLQKAIDSQPGINTRQLMLHSD
jgi:hypothetical protein